MDEQIVYLTKHMASARRNTSSLRYFDSKTASNIATFVVRS